MFGGRLLRHFGRTDYGRQNGQCRDPHCGGGGRCGRQRPRQRNKGQNIREPHPGTDRTVSQRRLSECRLRNDFRHSLCDGRQGELHAADCIPRKDGRILLRGEAGSDQLLRLCRRCRDGRHSVRTDRRAHTGGHRKRRHLCPRRHLYRYRLGDRVHR